MVLVPKHFSNGNTYVGDFCWGKCHGNGKLVISSKEYMGGMFVNGKLNGNGYIFQNGILYTEYGGFDCEDTTALCNDYKTLRFLQAQDNTTVSKESTQ
ncbi:unnamed protein product [Adineta steineri]|uniref:Uncharacterized protein n=1 Tax=Adineta steineri TaxID=433720 RepID=A0A814PDB9_9BILA|nr:unnamed protein product [Adineta steineri]CAF3760681.1 unnamed protein product [Adineta steineri]